MPYSKIDPDKMILRDHLAYDRTVLANERTLLSWFSAAIALLAAGGTLIKLFPGEPGMVRLGFISLAVGVVSVIVGALRFLAVRKRLSRTYEKLEH
jgi:putative membrane protein